MLSRIYSPPVRRALDKSWLAHENIFYYQSSEDWYCFGEGRETDILALTGPGTAFDSGNGVAISQLEPDQIVIVECANSGVHWMAPVDLDVRHVPPQIGTGEVGGIGGRYDGFHVGFGDGTVWCLSHDTPYELLELFFTTEGAKRNSRDDMLRKYKLEY